MNKDFIITLLVIFLVDYQLAIQNDCEYLISTIY